MKLTLLSILLFYSFLFSEQKILPSDGNELDGFGQSVSMNDEWIAVSANKSEYNDINSGSVYLYRTINDSLIYDTRIFPSDGSENPDIARSKVVFPQPEGPRKLKNSPFSILTLTFFAA